MNKTNKIKISFKTLSLLYILIFILSICIIITFAGQIDKTKNINEKIKICFTSLTELKDSLKNIEDMLFGYKEKLEKNIKNINFLLHKNKLMHEKIKYLETKIEYLECKIKETK